MKDEEKNKPWVFVLFLGQAKNEKPFQLEEKGSFLEFP